MTELPAAPLRAGFGRRLLVRLRCVSRVCAHSVRCLLRSLLILYFLFCIVLLGLRYLLLPHVADYKTEVEQLISHAIGREVQMGALRASWQGLNPQLVLQELVLHDLQGKPALALPEVRTTLSWWSLAALDLRFERIELLRPSLAMQRSADGKLTVGGFSIDLHGNSDGQGLDWLLAQRQIVIRDGDLSWNDQQLQAPPVHFTALNLIWQNRWRHHQFSLRATPPAALAAPLDLRGDFVHRAFAKKVSDISSWSGEVYADMAYVDLAAMKAYFDYPAQIESGSGALRAWLRLDAGRVADLTADLKLADVRGRLDASLPLLDMAVISGRVVASETAGLAKQLLPAVFGPAGHAFAIQHLTMRSRDGEVLPPTSVAEKFTPGSHGKPDRVELAAAFLDLQTLANFARHLPLPADQRQVLSDFAPRGQLRNFSASWLGSYPHIAAYTLKGGFEHLSLRAQAAQASRAKTASEPAQVALLAIPGFENLSGHLDASDKGGQFVLDARDISFNTAGYFIDPTIPLQSLTMQAEWKFIGADQLLFQVAKLDLQQDGMHASLSGSHRFMLGPRGQSEPGMVDVHAQVNGFDLKQLDRFIPTAAEPDLRHWLTKAILDGRADEVKLRLRGDLAYFPFSANDARARSKGEFLVKGNIHGGRLDFTAGALADGAKAPLWPVIEAIQGNFAFDRARMEIDGNSASTLSADLHKVSAVIPDLLSTNAVLAIDGQVSSSLQNMLNYVGASPVDAWLSHFLSETKSAGAAALHLKLQLPLRHLIDAKVQGQLQLFNNDVQLQPGLPQVTAANGKIEFNERGVNLGALKGYALGGALQVSGGSQKDESIRVRLDGSASAEGLLQFLPASVRAPLADKISGATRYVTTVNVKKQTSEIVIDSALQGLTLNFPSPLRKSASSIVPLHIELLSPVNGNLLQDDWSIHLGNLLHARYQRQRDSEKTANWKILGGSIGVGVAAPEFRTGIVANIQTPLLNVDEWRTLLSTAVANGSDSRGSVDIAPYLDVSSLTLKTAQLHLFGKQLDQATVGLSHQKNVWQANVDSNQVSGQLSWSDGNSSQRAGTVTARLSRLNIPASAASDVSDLMLGSSAATQLPALDIIVDDFELFDKKLGKLELLASNQTVAGVSEWQLAKVILKNPDAELKASGKWSKRAGAGSTELDYVLEVANSGQLLNRLGFANVIKGGRGRLQGDVSWSGLPYAIDIASMRGQVQLDLASGQFLKVDPGAAKLLGVLSMQSLPRRLSLDFRDVFSEGFGFDALTGTARIEQGVAVTDNFKMRGVNATVVISGSADMARETQQLHVVVIPVINAGAASVVYGLAVNPVIGLGTFLAQLFLREPLARAFTFEYMISGPWNDAIVKKIDHQDLKSLMAPTPTPDLLKGKTE
ncbi:YhdP family protein [Undibacterium sp. CCC3.4]|nr:YhdP family protein [Undibacterium sp. CCC3.4]MEB0213711.1 YhdP family protein [Undibacterium sp. 5I2]WPX43876.1 YhdP family protein [Undibacterium sp. CCC3.4]